MQVLLTGANGFLGKYIHRALSGYDVDTLGRKDCSINVDIGKNTPLFQKQYTIVIHAAGKAHIVPKNKKQADDFYSVNHKGTINITKAIDALGLYPKRFIFISTIAVYGLENGENIDEAYPKKGTSPYANSKILAENHLIEWGKKHNIDIVILRLPLIVGQNPPGNLGSMIKAIKKGYYFRIGDGSPRRSMVLAEDVAELIASDRLMAGEYNLTDGYNPSYKELEMVISHQLGKQLKSLPMGLVKFMGHIGDLVPIFPINSYKLGKLSSSLTLSCQKAKKDFNWEPKNVLKNFTV